jgi:hypothetical protein
MPCPVHNPHSRRQPQHIAHDADPKVRFGEAGSAGHILGRVRLGVSSEIKSEAKRDHEPWNDDIAQSKHGKVRRQSRGKGGFGSENLDGCIDSLGNCHHDWCGKDLELSVACSMLSMSAYPEDVVHEQQGQ